MIKFDVSPSRRIINHLLNMTNEYLRHFYLYKWPRFQQILLKKCLSWPKFDPNLTFKYDRKIDLTLPETLNIFKIVKRRHFLVFFQSYSLKSHTVSQCLNLILFSKCHFYLTSQPDTFKRRKLIFQLIIDSNLKSKMKTPARFRKDWKI